MLANSNSKFNSRNAGKNEEDRKCMICQFDFEEEDFLLTTMCLHKFHKECMINWAGRQDFCPVDRIPIDAEIDFE